MARSRSLGVVLVFSLVAGLVVGLPPMAVAAAAPASAASDRSVPVRPAVGRAATSSATAGPGVTRVPRPVLPSEASVVATSGVPASVGGLPVAVTVAPGEQDDVLSGARRFTGAAVGGLSRVQVRTAGPEVARAVGVRGVVLSVSGVDAAASGVG